MNWNRTHYMTVGFLMVFCGFHFRVVESFVLSPEATKFINEQHDSLQLTGNVYDASPNAGSTMLGYQNASATKAPNTTTAGFVRSTTSPEGVTQKIVTPPNWMGWPMIYVGAILALFGLTMQKE